MRKPVLIIMAFLICCQCLGQEKEQQKSAIKYSAGIAYNQIWLQSNCYGTDEYGTVSSSPFNWGVSPFFSIRNNRWEFGFSCSYLSFSRTQKYPKTSFSIDKWQEANLASTVGFRMTGERQLINVTPFLGVDLSYLINYEKDVNTGTWARHYNTDELGARNPYSDILYYLGIGLLGGLNVSCPVTKHFEIRASYCFKFKVLNNIRNDSNPHYPFSITSPVFYHNASIGVAYRFN